MLVDFPSHHPLSAEFQKSLMIIHLISIILIKAFYFKETWIEKLIELVFDEVLFVVKQQTAESVFYIGHNNSGSGETYQMNMVIVAPGKSFSP